MVLPLQPINKRNHQLGFIFPKNKFALFSSLTSAMRGSNAQIMSNKTHLFQEGIQYLLTLDTIFRSKISPLENIYQTRELCNISCAPDETIDIFAARLLTEIKTLNDKITIIDDITARDIFITGLGPDFTFVSTKLSYLPKDWNQVDINKIIPVAKFFSRTRKSFKLTKKHMEPFTNRNRKQSSPRIPNHKTLQRNQYRNFVQPATRHLKTGDFKSAGR